MGHDNFLHDLYDYPNHFIDQNQLESPLDGLTGYDPFSEKKDSKPRYYQRDPFYTPAYLRTTTSINDGQSSSPLSCTDKTWSSHSDLGDVLLSPDSPAASPYLPYIDEPWSPASVTTEPDDDASLASSIASLSPNSDLDTFPGEPTEDEDDDNFYSSLTVSPEESLYHLDQYQLHTSPDERSVYHEDDDLSPLTFSPPSLAPLPFLSLSELGHPPNAQKSSPHSAPFQPPQYNYHTFFDYDSSTPVPSSPSRRRSATLPELEPPTFNADLFGLHHSVPSETSPLRNIDTDIPNVRWYSFPGSETDDDLIPVDLASKNHIPDPSIIAPSTSNGIRSLLLWDQDFDDHSDIPTARSPSPEDFYLDPTLLAECGDEELRKVYELRQRTAKSEKWERERCRELSDLLRLKLDERGMFGGGEGGDCPSNHQSGSPSCHTNLPFSSSPSSDSPTVYQPQPRIPSTSSTSSAVSCSAQNPTSSSSSSTLPSTWGKSEGPKHKIRSMAQLVASMFFHRQCDNLRRYPSRKPCFESSSHYSSPLSSMGGGGVKVPSTPRSRLSKVILPEELELDSEEKGAIGDEAEEDQEKMDVDVDDGSLGCSCWDMELDDGGTYGNSNSHTVIWAAPPCTRESAE